MISGARWLAAAALYIGPLLPFTAEAASTPLGANTGDGSTPFTGLAQAPEASLFVGAATVSVPIDVPPGRGGLTPNLTLTYSSAGGQSPYGYGWDLPLGTVQRCLKHGVPSCNDPTYRNEFVLTLPTGAVECTLDNQGRCRPLVDESFLRIQYIAGGNRWDVRDRDGRKYTFGAVADARTGTNVSTLFVPETPASGGQGYVPCGYTFSWALTRVEDPNGNFMTVAYTNSEQVLYPQVIEYGGNSIGGLPSIFTVAFTWEGSITEGPVSSIAGFAAQTRQRLRAVEVRYLADLVRRYDFTYDPAHLTAREQSFLRDVTLSTPAGPLLNGIGQPARTTFLYQRDDQPFGFGAAQTMPPFLPTHRSRFRIDSIGALGTALVRDVFDINGDAIADLVDVQDCDGDWDVYLGSPSGFSTLPLRWSHAPGCFFIRYRHTAGYSNVVTETVDINGDGIPDYIDARPDCVGFDCDFGSWKVYLGRVGSNGTGWGFESTPIAWAKPVELEDEYTRWTRAYSIHTNLAGWNAPVVTRRDLIDMNADGLLDLVSTEDGNWRVWLNTGAGFAATPLHGFDAPYPFLRLSANGHEMIGVYDVNGDGLPDQIVACDRELHPSCPVGPFGGAAWDIYLNGGRSITPVAQQWSFGLVPLAPGIRRVIDERVVRDFFDINGDGLPDVVDIVAGADWNVYLNSGFELRESAMIWAAGSNRIRDANSDGLTEKDTFDFDGDGLVDFVDFDPQGNDAPTALRVRRTAAGAWCASSDGAACSAGAAATVAPNPEAGWGGLLVQMENGIGGSTYLEYRPSTEWDNDDAAGVPQLPLNLWTVSAIESDDGMCDAFGTNCVGVAGAAHTTRTELRYTRGVYDHEAREFRGFGTVEHLDAEGNLTRNEFLQDHALKGKTAITERFAADAVDPYSRPIDRTLQYWQCADHNGVSSTCSIDEPLWIRQAGSLAETFSNFSFDSSSWTATSQFTWQQCDGEYTGNPRTVVNGGAHGITVSTHTTYACAPDTHILDKPIHVEVRDGSTATALERRWLFYDGDAQGNPLSHGSVTRGNLTRVEAWLDQAVAPLQPPSCTEASAERCAATTTAYDAIGNVTRAVDANGHATTFAYSAATHFLYPSLITNALGHKVGTGHNVPCGQPEWQTRPYLDSPSAPAPPPSDPSYAKTRRRYDSLCRLLRTANADENIDTSPHQVFLYSLGAVQRPTVMTVFTTEPHYSQTWDPASPEGQALPGPSYLPVWTLTDALGRPIQRQRRSVIDGQLTTVAAVTMSYDQRGQLARQYVAFGGVTGGQFTTPSAAAGYQELTHDAAGRLTRRTNPDGGARTWDHGDAWQTTARDECYLDAGCVGGKTVEVRDAAGSVVEKRLYAESGGGESLAAKTRYAHDGAGRLLSSEQWNGSGWDARTKITHTYDSLGRRVSLHDPDSGLWTYGYDLVGNLRWQDDPKSGQHVQLCYDQLGRVRKKYVFTNVDFAPAFLTCGFGPTEEYVYDDSANPNGLGRLAAVSDPSGSTWFQHDARGRVASVNKSIAVQREPPAQDDPPQWGLFLYTYDAADHVTSIRYPDGEIVAHGYDASGQLNRLESDSGKVYLTDLTYDVFGRRRRIGHGDGTIDERAYHAGKEEGYRLSSIVTRVSNSRYLDLAYSAYSRKGLITRIDDRAYPNASDPRSSSVTYNYDGLGRLVRASGNNLPAAPNDIYQYDALGNMTRKESRVLAYGTNRPHQLATINGAAVGIAHDANGNRLGKPGRTYEYDPEGRLAEVDGGAVVFQYDYTGRQVAKVVGGSVARYFNELAETHNGTLVKYYLAGGLRVASRENAVWQTAATGQARSTMLASASDPGDSRTPATTPMLRIAAASGALGIVVLAIAPLRGRRRLGLSIRREQVFLAIAVWILGTLPLPNPVRELRPRDATAGGGAPVCYTCQPTDNIDRYHVDHLGSTQLITRNGGVVHHVRYTPFGSVRGWYNGSGAPIAMPANRYEFTGYESDATSGLQYAGARFYDPELGLFLTHDPQRQFPSPYAYGSWNPVNGVDPDGEFFFLVPIVAAIVEVATAVVAAAQAALATLLPYLKTAVLATIEGAAKGAAFGFAKGSIEAIVSGDAGAIVDGLKNGAIGGAIGGLVIDGTGLGDALGQTAGPALGLSDFASPSSDFVTRAAEVGLRGAISGAAKGAVGGAANSLVSGGDLRQGVREGLIGGSIGGAFGNLFQPAIDEVSLAAVGPLTSSVGESLGVSPPTDLAAANGSLGALLSPDIGRAAAGGALAEAHKGVGEFVKGGVSRLGKFDAADLGSGALKGARRGGGDLFTDRAKGFYDHHIKPVIEGPWVDR